MKPVTFESKSRRTIPATTITPHMYSNGKAQKTVRVLKKFLMMK